MPSSVRSISPRAVDERSDDDQPAINRGTHSPQAEDVVHRDEVALEPRSYQLEMLDESLRRNIIVAVSSLTLCSAFHH